MADFINWEVMLDEGQTPRHAGSHIGQLKNLFVDAIMIASNSSGDYQGHDSIVYLFAPANPNVDPKIVLITSYFGSCGGCDVWENCSNDELRALFTAIANNARTFDSFEEINNFFSEIIKWIEGDESYGEYYDLHDHVYELRKQIKKAEIKLGEGSVA